MVGSSHSNCPAIDDDPNDPMAEPFQEQGSLGMDGVNKIDDSISSSVFS